MTLKEKVEEVKKWSIANQLEFCSKITFNITIGIRSILSNEDEINSAKLEAIRWINDYQKNGNNEIILTVDYDVIVNEIAKYHKVKRGESLSKIAQRNNMTLDKLLELNPDITNINLVYPNQKIRIK